MEPLEKIIIGQSCSIFIMEDGVRLRVNGFVSKKDPSGCYVIELYNRPCRYRDIGEIFSPVIFLGGSQNKAHSKLMTDYEHRKNHLLN